jgi:hypothetical protein
MSNFKLTSLGDDKELILPDLSYDSFTNNCSLYKYGASDLEYAKYLRNKGMVELSSFNAGFLKDSILTFTSDDGERILKFKLIEDSDDNHEYLHIP